MTHLDPSSLATYNSLVDPHLESYFSNERIRSHLKHAGLISRQGEIISDGEYRSRLARREHKKHVRHMLAENIVNRAIDMERTRQAGVKREFETIAKAAMVHNIKESKRRSGTLSGLMTHSTDMALLSIDTSWQEARPKSATHHQQIEMFNEETRIPRIQSAHVSGDHGTNYSSKTLNRPRHRSLRRPKSSNKNRSSSLQRHHSPTKYPDSSPCQIKMIYYGPHTKVDYDHLVFEPIDEIIVMQQHCGGENLVVYKEKLKAGEEFTFNSRRHSDYPFGLSLYVKGLIDSRISTCCEHKHRHGVRLGGDRGHFAIKSVHGSKPCIKCRFEKQARLKKYAQSPKEKDDENKKSITISIPVSDEPKTKQAPVQIPVSNESKTKPVKLSVRHTSNQDENYSDDFDGSEKQQSSDRNRSSGSRGSTPKAPPRTSAVVEKKTSRKSNSSFDETPRDKELTKKTWQIIFHTPNDPTGNFQIGKNHSSKKIFLKFAFIAMDEEDETETYELDMNKFKLNSKAAKQYSFPIQLKNIGNPKQIRLKIQTTGSDDDDDDDDDYDDIKWHLDHIELIDPQTQTHFIFPCNQWILSSRQKTLQLSQESPAVERRPKSGTSTNGSKPYSSNRQQSPKVEQKAKTSSRSSVSSTSPKHVNSTRKISSTNQLTQKPKTTPRSDSSDQENKIRYRIIIYPASDHDGEFNPAKNSRMYLRLNDQSKEINLTTKTDKLCPTFEPGEEQTFEFDSIQNTNEKLKKLTIGYINTDIAASKWKLQKIILINLETNEKVIFLCKENLIRNDFDSRAEQTFEVIQLKESDDESISKHKKIDSRKSSNNQQTLVRSSTPEKQKIQTRSSTPDEQQIKPRSSVSEKQKIQTRSSTPDEEQTKPRSSVPVKQKIQSRPSTSDEEQMKPSSTIPEKQKIQSRSSTPDEQQIKPRSSVSEKPKTQTRSSTPDEQQIKPRSSVSEKPKTQTRSSTPDDEQTKPRPLVPEKQKIQSRSSTPDEQQIKPRSSVSEKPKTQTRSSTPDDEQTKPRPLVPEKQKIQSRPSISDEEQIKPRSTIPEKQQINNINKQKSPSFQSMTDEDANYKKIFEQLDPDGKLHLGSRSPSPSHGPSATNNSRPKTRHGRQDQFQQEKTNQPVDPLKGLDELSDQTARSNDQLNQNSFPSRTTDNVENHFQRWYPPNDDYDDN